VEAGATGGTGPAGQRGPRGKAGKPGKDVDPVILTDLHNTIAKLKAEAEIQFQRIAQLQAQLDVVLGELRRLKL